MNNNYSFRSMIKRYTSSSAILILSTILALICANTALKEFYFALWENPISVSIGDFNLFSHNGHEMSLMAVINDFLMAIFFLSVGLEIKREILVGELSSPQKALLPIIGACGGMIIPILCFLILCPNDPQMLRGAAIPMATDIAFSLGVLSIFSKRVPLGLKVFLAALAVADDLGGIIVIALFYSANIDTTYIALSLICIAILAIGNIRRVRAKSFYLLVGLALWYTMLNSGIHATIAGVIVAFFVPASLRKASVHYIERIRKNINSLPSHDVTGKHHTVILSNNEIHKLKSIESAADKLISPLQALEDDLHTLIGYVIIPLFAFANVGIDLSTMSLSSIIDGVGLPVMISLVVGKFTGVLGFSWVAVKCKVVQLPKGCNWNAFIAVCMLCGIGLTVSIFIADLSYASLGATGATMLGQAKLGILCGSMLSTIIGCILLNKFLPKEIICEE